MTLSLPLLLTAALVAGPAAGPASPPPRVTNEIIVTAARGDRQRRVENVRFGTDPVAGPVITVHPDSAKQTINGIGTSFTESSAYVLAHLTPARRREVMARIFGRDGADFTLARTHIGSCDFSMEGRYSYCDRPGDQTLARFSIAPDSAGFDPAVHPGVVDPRYDLLPMIHEAQAIKRAHGDTGPRIIASAWTAPPWMKQTEDWYTPGTEENGWQGHGGALKPEHEATYAAYLVRYLDAYADAGVPIWGLTPVNEPHGNGGNWESMDFTAESQGAFVRAHLGPRLAASRHADTKLLVFDQNRDGLAHWADVFFGDPRHASHVDGIAIHWYASTVRVFEEVLDAVHARYPDFEIIHTEGCIDNLGNPAPGGIADPEGFQEEGWFANDDFWWQATATDWAYTATWAGPGAADHPRYVPVHRYARNIIVSLDHWVAGWIDWNIVLDRHGGPNHVGNFCGAPIMIDTDTGEIHYTPVFHVLSQFSRTIRPGDRAVWTQRELAGLDPDALHACATRNADGLLSVQVLNTTTADLRYGLRIGAGVAQVTIPANAVQTVRVQLPAVSR